MLASLVIALAASSLSVAAPPADPPIKVWLSNDGEYVRGDYSQVKFRTAEDGYVLLLHADADGRIRVLFPLDPADDNFVRGQKTFEIGGRESQGTFYIDYADGSGMVYAAWSRDPFKFGDFVRADHWDYRVFEQYRIQTDPESELTDLVLRMTDREFDFAVARYTIYARADYSSSESYGGTTYVGLSFGWGYPSYWYDPYPYCCGFYYPVHYPWYGYPYYPYYGGGYYPYYPYYPYYGYRPGYPGYPGYGYPYGNNRGPYTFKPGGTVFGQPTTYRPRTEFVNKASVFDPTRRPSPTTPYRPRGTTAPATGAASTTRPSTERRPAPSANSTERQPVSGGHVEAGRRPATAKPAPMPTYVRPESRSGATTGRSTEPRRTTEARPADPSNRSTSSPRSSTTARGEPRFSRRASSSSREAPMPEYIRLERPSDNARSGGSRSGSRGVPEYVRPSRGGGTSSGTPGGSDRPSARSPAPSHGPSYSAPAGRSPGVSAPAGRSPGYSAPAARAPSSAPSSRGGISGGGGGRGR
jgi:uncharacterized protein DUF4384